MTDQAGQASNAPQVAVTDPRLRELMGGKAESSPQPSQQGAVVGNTEPREFEVDVGGVKRRVPVEQLVQAWRTRDQVEESQKAANAALAQASQNQALKQFQERLASLPAARRAQILQLMDGEAPAADDGLPNFDDNAPGESPTSALEAKLARLEQATNIMAGHVGKQMQEHRQQTLGQRVEQLMGEFPVFRGADPAAVAMAQDSIMTQVSLGNSDPEAIVQSTARKLAEMQVAREQRERERLGVRPMMAPADKRVLTGAGMKSGQLRAAAMDFFKRTQQ